MVIKLLAEPIVDRGSLGPSGRRHFIVLASVGWAAIAVMRPLTFPVAWELFNGAGPIAVQATVPSCIVGSNGAFKGGKGCVSRSASSDGQR